MATIMLITRKSPFSGKTNSMDIAITESQLERWKAGELIQSVAPELNADEREFIITGTTPEEWDSLFS